MGWRGSRLFLQLPLCQDTAVTQWVDVYPRAFAQGRPSNCLKHARLANRRHLQIGIRSLLLDEFNESGTFHEVPGGISSHYKIIIHNVTLLCAVSLGEKPVLQLLETEVPPDKLGLGEGEEQLPLVNNRDLNAAGSH